jgi:hypothetical protein
MKRTNLLLCIKAPLVVCLLFGEASSGWCQNKSIRVAAPNISAGVEDPRLELIKALRKLKTAYPYRQTVSTTTTEKDRILSSETSVTEFASASRMRVKLSSKDGKRSEMIIIDNFNYFYFEGKWSRQEWSANDQATIERDQDKFISSLSDVKFAGLETLNRVKCRVYTYRWGLDISVSGKLPDGVGKAWIGVADGLPYQMDSDLEINEHHTKSHTVYEYRVRIRIVRPKAKLT